jgi:cation-transporting ATPase F
LSSVHAVDLAAEEATVRVAPLVVVYTVEPEDDPARLPAHRRLLDLVVSQAQAEHPGLSVSADLVYGEPVDALLRWSTRACLLVVGHREGALTGRSVAADVAARATVPVIVYRPRAEHQPTGGGPVLVGVSAAAGTEAVVAFAFEEAELRGAPVVAVSVGGERPLVEALGGWPAKYPEVELRLHVPSGTDALVAAAHDGAVVVVGSERQGPELGATARRLIDTAGCPVAVVSDLLG